MEKRIYVLPQTEVTNLGALGRWMKELGEASLASHMGAPERQPKAF
jgi:hypothetical protein